MNCQYPKHPCPHPGDYRVRLYPEDPSWDFYVCEDHVAVMTSRDPDVEKEKVEHHQDL